MSSWTQNDSVIDDDDEVCPLCIEEFDLSDKNFKPCPCGYQICQFCYNNIKTHSEEGRCPNCRRVYDESTIQYRVPDADEFKADLALKHRKAAAAKKKEAEKREIEASSRKNLAGVRVVQKNLVYVIGLNPTIQNESQLLQTLRGEQYFGQYGDIDKIVVSKAKPGGNANQGIGVYVTFSRKADAATCIAAVDGSPNGDRVLRAQYGTTKYCSSFLRNEQCNNRNCTFLHETGEDTDSFSRQDLSSMNTMSSQRGHGQQPYYNQPVQQTRPAPHAVQPPVRQNSKDEATHRFPPTDASALPSSASWANKDAQVQRARRSSLAASRTSPSPTVSNAGFVKKNETVKRTVEKATEQAARQQTPAPAEASTSTTRDTSKTPPSSAQNELTALDNLIKAVNSPGFRFVFSPEGLSPEDLAYIENHPSLIDPYGGAKRRAMREKAERERAKQEAESRLLPTGPAEDENLESGSSQLGGEPEDVQAVAVGRPSREPQSAIQPPSHQATAANSTIGSPVSAGPQFQGLNTAGRGLTPQEQQQLMLLKSVNGQQMGLMDQLPTGSASAFDQNAQLRAGLFQNQMPQMSTSGHARQSSRFSFANDSNAKNAGDQRILSQQPSVMQTTSANPLNTPATPQGLGNHFFTSGIQGSPPGLKTAGTPPISGGGMFAQGHGFTSTMNNNLGLGSKPDGNAEAMRELMRGRSGTSGVHGHDAAKREFMFPFLQQLHSTPPPLAPVSGLLNSFYGHQAGSPRQDQGPGAGPQKQKKRGKKHRHANTSSGGGGGVVDLADPSILQARMHQGAAATAAQGLYGSQGQEDEDFPPLGPPSSKVLDEFRTPSRRAGTPTLPPGLPLPHAHPTPPPNNESGSPLKTSEIKPVQPAIPLAEHGVQSPVLGKIKAQGISRQGTPDTHGSPMSKSLKAVSLSASPAGSPRSSATPQPALARESRLSSPSLETAEPSGVKSLKENQDRQTPRPKPIKLNLSLPAYPRDESPSKAPQAPQPVSNNGPSSAAGSRPNTPGTTVSRASDPSQHRQARVLRVVDTPKSETPPLQAAVAQSGATTATAGQKQRGRKPSASSASRSETPVEVTSEYDPFTSASASRANSPPPSRVGSAPVRTMTKSQVKKERKLKAKKEEAKKEESLPSSAVVEEPVQAPIIGRKRKTKKPSTTATKSSEQSQRTSSEGAAEQQTPRAKSPVKSEPKDKDKSESSSGEKSNERKEERRSSEEKVTKGTAAPKKEKTEPWQTNNTLEQLLNDADATGASIKDLLLERTAPLHVLLGQLHQSGDLDLNTHPLFNPPNITQRFDMKCTADDYDMLKRPIELTDSHRKQLLQGKPVRIQGPSNSLKDRCLITPTGCVLRHLAPEEENRYLELEKSLVTALDSLHEYPALNIPERDVTNRGGGLDALFAAAEKFNIHWVDGSNPQSPSGTHVSDPVASLPTSSTTTARSTTQTIGESIRSMLTSAPAASASAGGFFSNTGDVSSGDIADLMNLSGEELKAMIESAARELEGSRREVEIVDKKVMGLVKRNRKLVQQALAVVGEVASGAVGSA